MLLIQNGRDEMIHRFSIFAVTAGLFLVLAMTGSAYAHGDEVHERPSGQADMPVPAQDRHGAQAFANAKAGSPAPMQDEGGHDHSAHAGWADTGFERFLNWIGKLHPAATNFPIGLLLGAALAEALRFRYRTALLPNAARFMLWAGTVSAVGTVILGWFFAGFSVSSDGPLLAFHRWNGTAVAILALAVLWLGERHWREQSGPGLYRTGLFVLAVLAGLNGYLGGRMLYGADHYAYPAAHTHSPHSHEEH
jgi:uncharacterized membrane protein